MPTATAKRRPASRPRSSANGSTRDANSRAAGFRRARITAVRKAADKAGCDALLISNPTDIRYLTGFRGEDSFALLTRKSLTIISDFRFEEELAATKGVAEVFIRGAKPMMDAVKAVAADHTPNMIGVQSEHMSVDQRRRLAKALGAKRVKDTVSVLRDCRICKDDYELALIQQSVRVCEKALLRVLETIEVGQTEAAIAARLEYELKMQGAERVAFEPIVAAGANGSLPHAVPGKDKVRSGRTLLIDWGARVDGYVSDMTRTFAIGRWPEQMREVYEVVLEAHEAAAAAVAPGKTTKDLDSIARGVITRAGYGPRFGHSLGHGVGLDVHEGPRLSQQSEDVLRPRMVVTIEPGIYIPGVGGVRIEDDVLVTQRGGESMCSLPKSIGWATR